MAEDRRVRKTKKAIQNILIRDVCAIIDEYPCEVCITKAPEIWKLQCWKCRSV